jgi:hypothetical protein
MGIIEQAPAGHSGALGQSHRRRSGLAADLQDRRCHAPLGRLLAGKPIVAIDTGPTARMMTSADHAVAGRPRAGGIIGG